MIGSILADRFGFLLTQVFVSSFIWLKMAPVRGNGWIPLMGKHAVLGAGVIRS